MKMWIKFIPYAESTGRLKSIFDRVAGRGRTVDNILTAHSLRPHTLTGHMALYKSVLHHSGNIQPVWFLETIGVFVSHLNGCRYCFEHHFAGLRRHVDADRADEIAAALRSAVPAGDGVDDDETVLFSESITRFLVEIEPGEREAFEAAVGDTPFAVVGKTTDDGQLRVAGRAGTEILSESISDLAASWRTPLEN